MDKTKRIIDMTEHPERYSEDELRQLLMDDEEGRKIYRTICELCAALDGSAAVATRRLPLVGKIAAVFVGVCLLSQQECLATQGKSLQKRKRLQLQSKWKKA